MVYCLHNSDRKLFQTQGIYLYSFYAAEHNWIFVHDHSPCNMKQ